MTTFVLVHGAFTDGLYWSETATAMRAAGHEVHVIERLPSSGPDPAMLGGAAEDVAAVRAALDVAGGPAVLVGHSLGGFWVTDAADHPAIARTVYVSAFVPHAGEAPLELLAGAGGPTDWVVPGEQAFTVIDDLDRLREILCADVEPERARAVLGRLGPQSAAAAMTPASAPARSHPVTYVVCDDDVAIPRAAQERFAAVAGAEEVLHLPSSHQPMTSMPERLADVLGAVRT